MAIVVDQDGFVIESTTTGSGTGNYLSFLRIQANDEEAGYNTDDDGQLDNKDGPWTHSLLIADLDVITVEGEDYYEIRLDLNEAKNGAERFITLEELQFYVGGIAGTTPTQFTGLTNVFDLDDPVVLEDANHGSGTDDYHILIPVDALDGLGDYLTLYAEFSGTADGFEEFRALADEDVFIPTPDIGVLKETEGTDDDCPELLVGSDVTWTYTVENNGNIDLTNVIVTDDNGTPGDTGDDFAATYVSGDDGDMILQTDETWIFSYTGTVGAGEYENIATVTAGYAYDNGEGGITSGSVSGFEEDCYYGVTPTIQIVKYTNDQDNVCAAYLVGQAIVWTYEVTNTSDTEGDVYIDGITITDDAGTPGDNSPESDDDFSPGAVLKGDGIHNVGDDNDNGQLDIGETWLYTATLTGGAVAGEYENTATVNGTAHDAYSNTSPVQDDESDCYFGADPDIDIVKKTNGTNDVCPVVSVGSTVTWTYFVENTGNVALENLVITDDNGTPGENSPESDDDFNPAPELDNGFNVGDLNTDGIFDPGEIWQYIATGTALEGEYENTAYVSGDFTDDFDNSTKVYANEDDCYLGVEGPGVRTPGFWSNWTDFWDGDASVPKQAGDDCFPLADLLYPVDGTGDGVIDAKKGLLIGDYDRDGTNLGEDGLPGTADDEDVIFICLDDALALINANNKQMSDGVVKIGRDVVASWLNYLAGNAIGEADDEGSPHHFIDDAVDYLQIFGDSNNSNAPGPGNGFIDTDDYFDIYSKNHTAVKTSSAYWNSDFPGGDHTGAEIHGFLDEYNNYGTVDGNLYAHDCDTEQTLATLKGAYVDGVFFSM